VILFTGLAAVGGWGEVQRICGDQLDLVRSASDPQFPWTGVLLASPIIGFWYWCTDQYIVQRTLSAKNQAHARRGAIFAGYMKLLPVFIFLVPGMIAYTMKQKGLIQLESADQAFPALVSVLLPVGVKGIVVGGLVAALMSSLASLFNSSATLFTVDFYKRYRPHSSEKHLVFVGRIATATVVVLGIAWIPLMKSIAGVLYEYLQNVQSLIAPAIAAVFLLGVSSKRISGVAGVAGLVSGFSLGMVRLVLDVFDEWLARDGWLYKIVEVNWLHYSVFLFVFTVAVILVVSRFTKPPEEKRIEGLTFQSSTREQIAETRASWNYWDVIHSAVILAVIVAFYAYFW